MSAAVKKLRLAVFASGRGSNFLALHEATRCGALDAEIVVLLSDQAAAPALVKAEAAGIPAYCLEPKHFAHKAAYETAVIERLQPYCVDFIALAGYMRMVGPTLLAAYPQRMVNIHPALLPAFPGLNAQRQALDYGVKLSGCTVHLVDAGVDTGPIILQAAVPVYAEDDEESLSARILAEEHTSYAQALQLLAEGRVRVEGRRVRIAPRDDQS